MEVTGEEEEEEVSVWSWGAGTDGQLVTCELEDAYLPQPIPCLSRVPTISHIACGGAHAVALTGDGKALTWGRGTKGQLGHGEVKSCLEPRVVEFLEGFRVSCVSAGWNHSGFVTDTGCLFMCGDGLFGQLGSGDNQSSDSPTEILFFAPMHVEQVACGMRHSLVLVKGSSGHTVYGFGAGRHGQIGKLEPGSRSSSLPILVPGFNSCHIVRICANGDCSAALTANGQLYTWGRGFRGRLDDHLLQAYPSSLRFSDVALGWNHALVISDGKVYMLGGDHHGTLATVQKAQDASVSSSCISSDGEPPVRILQRVPGLEDEEAVCIAAGAEHSALVTRKGTVMTWGWGEHGQLGLGDTSDQTFPQVVNISGKGSLADLQLRVYCGSGFTFLTRLPH